MNPTQNNNGGKNRRQHEWQEPEPERTQKFITPGAEKSLREGAGRYRRIRSMPPRAGRGGAARRGGQSSSGGTERRVGQNAGAGVPQGQTAPRDRGAGAAGNGAALQNTGGDRFGASPRNGAPRSGEKQPRPRPSEAYKDRRASGMTFGEAVRAELRDRLHMLRMGISLNSEDIIRAVICAMLIIFTALWQTTFFNRFSPFGAVPDLMLSLTAAIAFTEDEKWGAVCGLCSAVVIQSLGTSGAGPQLLPLLYTPVGYIIGILSSSYLRGGVAVKALYIAACGVGRAAVSAVTASRMLSAGMGQIFAKIVIPEFFSTALTAPIVYFTVWLCLHWFHKSREQRTDSGAVR